MSLTSECVRSSAPPPPDADVDTTSHSRRAFCLSLKAARERRGVSIATIAETTKVCPSHFVALERGDVARWPHGLFRRAFFRGYVEMIGLPVAETLEEFLRLFPEEAPGPHAAAPRPQPADNAPRLVLDDSWRGVKTPILSRLAAATIDGAVVVLLPGMLARLSGVEPATIVALAAVGYFTIATAVFGESPASWLLRRRAHLARIWQRNAGAAPQAKPTAEPIEAFHIGEEVGWTTDARRIRPRYQPPRIRVRFKWS